MKKNTKFIHFISDIKEVVRKFEDKLCLNKTKMIETKHKLNSIL